MLVDTNLTIAYKCAACGAYEFFSISLFELSAKKEHNLKCRCNASGITVAKSSPENCTISVPCIGCGGTHKFVLKIRDLLYKALNVLCCDTTKVHICFIGDDKLVGKSIDNLEKECDKLMSELGYENYFKNTRVMYDTLNKIHDIAENGNLYCECGNDEVETVLFSDRVEIRCPKCGAVRVIGAASNDDLKDTLGRQHLLLLCETASSDAKS